MKKFLLLVFSFACYAAENVVPTIDNNQNLILRFVKPSGKPNHDIILRGDNAKIIKEMSGMLKDLFEGRSQTEELIPVPIALEENSDDYFSKLLLPLTKHLYLIQKNLLPKAHLNKVRGTINKLSAEENATLLKLSLFFDIPELANLLMDAIAYALTDPQSIEKLITEENYIENLSIPYRQGTEIAHRVTLYAREALMRNIAIKKQKYTNPTIQDYITTLAWNNSGTLLAVGYPFGNKLTIWDIQKNRYRDISTTLQTEILCWSPDGTMVATTSYNSNTAYFYNVATGEMSILLANETPITAMSWSSDGRLAIAGLDNTIYLWDMTQREVIQQLNGHTEKITSLAWSSDGKSLASGSNDKTVRLWSHNGQQTIANHQDQVLEVCWGSNGNYVVSCSKEIYIWDTKQQENIFYFPRQNYFFESVSLNPQCTLLAASANESEIIFIDISTRQVLNGWVEIDLVAALRWNPDSNKHSVVYGNDKAVVACNMQLFDDTYAKLNEVTSLQQALFIFAYPELKPKQRTTAIARSLYRELPKEIKNYLK
ncbi:MAG: hypothetical protein M1114_00900 [Candidatus Dependentiae bacterium]|nr:hypothetical protein [Candidatus Dependentiae bacterium]